MKSTLAILLFLAPLMTGATCENASGNTDGNPKPVSENKESMGDTLVVRIGSREFIATLDNNPTANAFRTLLPLTMKMTELNGNEKYFDLSGILPADESRPGRINTGDLLLYGSKTVVLFYESFSTSYSYTKLGRITKPDGLAEALGSDDVVVIIELKK